MPIRKDLRKFYGREWHAVTRPRILERAGNCCERCGKPNHATIWTLTRSSGGPRPRRYENTWSQRGHAPGNAWFVVVQWEDRPSECHRVINEPEPFELDSMRTIRVVLTIAHLNHQAGDDRDENLQALCQWCHLIHDRAHHFDSRATRKDQARPLLCDEGPPGFPSINP